MKNKMFIVAAHPDDEILGLGGTMRKHILAGDEVHCLILGEGMTSRSPSRNEAEKSELNLLHQHSREAANVMGFASLSFGSLPDNRFDSLDLLDIVKVVEKFVAAIKPKTIYTHHGGDLNIDHQYTFQAVMTACRPVGDYSVKEIYTFETPSSTEWQFSQKDTVFQPNVFVDIEDTIETKLQAMNCYKTELREYPHSRSLEALNIIAARWGTVVGKKYAEAFQLIRKVE